MLRQDPPLTPTIFAPSSKSVTSRAVLMAGLAAGESLLVGIDRSEDVDHMLTAVSKLGAQLIWEKERVLRIIGVAGQLRKCVTINVGESGICARFLTALLATQEHGQLICAEGSLLNRPMQDLLEALQGLGVRIKTAGSRSFPLYVHGPWRKELAYVDSAKSSQFLSALLIAAANRKTGVFSVVQIADTVSSSYIKMTVELLRLFGVSTTIAERRYTVSSSGLRAACIHLPGDASQASYFFSWAAIMGRAVELSNLSPFFCQGDRGFLAILESMGCKVEETGFRVRVSAHRKLKAWQGSMNTQSDVVASFAVLALFADGPSRVTNVAHMRLKESDRLAAMAWNLRRLGVKVVEHSDGIDIWPLKEDPPAVELKSFADHRIAMAFSVLGQRYPQVRVDSRSCINKTYPRFFKDIDKLQSPT